MFLINDIKTSGYMDNGYIRIVCTEHRMMKHETIDIAILHFFDNNYNCSIAILLSSSKSHLFIPFGLTISQDKSSAQDTEAGKLKGTR